MAKKKDEDGANVQDQGSLNEPVQSTEPQNRVLDVPAGDESGGPVNPVLGRLDESQSQEGGLGPQEGDPATEPDYSSSSNVGVVNEHREAGQPLNEVVDERPVDEQGAATPGGTGASAGAGAGSVDT